MKEPLKSSVKPPSCDLGGKLYKFSRIPVLKSKGSVSLSKSSVGAGYLPDLN